MSRVEVDIPAGKSGIYEVANYTNETTDKNWQVYLELKSETHSSYNVLLKDGCPMPIMQDSEGEYNEHQWLWDNATGDVLIAGLGLGLINEVLINNDNVTSVTIVEISQDVIDLVWDHCKKDDRFNLVRADIETWDIPDGSSWDVAWFDTWISDNPLNTTEYKDLINTKFDSHCNKLGFWGSL